MTFFLSRVRVSSSPKPLNSNTLGARALRMTMSAGASQPGSTAGKSVKDKKSAGKQQIKFLMLHGYTQSGPLFRAKTRAIEKLVAKSLSPFGFLPVLFYPTAPIKLSPSDIPGYSPAEGAEEDDAYEPEAYAWFRKEEATGQYRHFSEGMEALSKAIEEAGGVDGVVGFSQGGAVAVMVASALESQARDLSSVPGAHKPWVEKLRAANGETPLKFAVSYSGFWGPPEDLQWLYDPRIETPTLHYLGSLDSVVVESRSTALVDRCKQPIVVTHPGGHYVPVNREWVNPLTGFIKDSVTPKKEKDESEDEFAALG